MWEFAMAVMVVMLYCTMGSLMAIIFGSKSDQAMRITIGMIWPIFMLGAIVYSLIRTILKMRGGKEC